MAVLALTILHERTFPPGLWAPSRLASHRHSTVAWDRRSRIWVDGDLCGGVRYLGQLIDDGGLAPEPEEFLQIPWDSV